MDLIYQNEKNNTLKEYYIMDYDRKWVKCVGKNTFTQSGGHLVMFRGRKFKMLNITAARAKEMKHVYAAVIAQSLEDVFDFSRGVRIAIDILTTMGRTDRLYEQLKPYLALLTSELMTMMLEIVSDEEWSWQKLVRLVLSWVRLFTGAAQVHKTVTAQSFESLMCALASFTLPSNVMEILKRISFFSNVKIFDDTSLLLSLCSDLVMLIERLTKHYIGIELDVWGRLKSVFSIGSHYWTLSRAKKIVNSYRGNTQVLIKHEYRKHIETVVQEFNENTTLMEWKRHSATVQSVFEQLDRINRISLAYGASARQEPFCFAFEGAPGTYKSTLMTNLVASINTTSYAHSVQSSEGKDWHDSYDNQEIYYMDDVGAQGVFQFSTLINLVSNVIYPLQCSDSKLKDTKFFSSEAIFFTTNSFSTMSNICKNDRISHPSALWRRVFTFRVEALAPMPDVIYRISGKYYNPMTDRWENNFPPDVLAFVRKHGFNESVTIEGDEQTVVRRLTEIYGFFRTTKRSHRKRAVITPEFQAEMAQLLSTIEAQSEDEDDHCKIQLEILNGLVRSNLENIVLPSEDTSYWNSLRGYVGKVIQGVAPVTPGMKWATKVVVPVVVAAMASLAYRLLSKRHVQLAAQSVNTYADEHDSSNNTANAILRNNMRMVTLQSGDYETLYTGLISGHYVIGPAHVVCDVEKQVFLTVYNNYEKRNIVCDHIPASLVYVNYNDDVSIYKMDDSTINTFRSVSGYLGLDCANVGAWLITNGSCLSLKGMVSGSYITYNRLGRDYYHNDSDTITYPFQSAAMCGSVVYSASRGIIGIHVAADVARGTGYARLWTPKAIADIREIIKRDRYFLDLSISDRVSPNLSGAKLDVKVYGSTPKKTSIVASPLYAEFPISKVPVELSKYGVHTVKDVNKGDLIPVKHVDENALAFAKREIEACFDDFEPLPEREVVLGNALLARFDPLTSNGPYTLPDRKSYLDYEAGCYTQLLWDDIRDINSIADGEQDINYKSLAFQVTLKDEIRSISKEGVPRSFCVLRFPINVLLKQHTGRMVESILKFRSYNGVMVGINPYTDYHALWLELEGWNKIDADFKSYDKSMLPQVQFMIRDVIVSKYQANTVDKQRLRFLLTLLIYSLNIVNDDLWLTNHSLPSGCYLTAILNSLVNRAYIAMWYYHNTPKASLDGFHKDVKHKSYGDDLLMGVNPQRRDLTAVSLDQYMTSIGLSMTSSNKGKITTDYMKDEDITFLKRSFRFNSLLKRYMCPLDRGSMMSSLSWVDGKKDMAVVMEGKIRAFQMEAFLHPDGEELVDKLIEACEARGVPYERLSKARLYDMFASGEAVCTTMSGYVIGM